MIEEINKQLL